MSESTGPHGADRTPTDRAEPDGPDRERREALKTLGTYGVYVAPALVAMLQAEKAVAQTGPGIP